MHYVPPVRAFSLVEVTLALGIATFCLVVIFGLLNVGVSTSSGSVEQTNASNILCAVAADLRAAPTPSGGGTVQGAQSAVYQMQLPLNVAAGGSTPAPVAAPSYTKLLDANGQPVATGGRYQLDVWTMPGVGRNATLARVMVSWPPAAKVPAGTVESLVSLDRN